MSRPAAHRQLPPVGQYSADLVRQQVPAPWQQSACYQAWRLHVAGMTVGDDSTKFSPWLATGCLSPRMVYHELKKYESQRTSNKSTYWVR